MFQFLRTHSEHIPRICQEIVTIFKRNLLNERITYPLLNFLDLIMSSGKWILLPIGKRFINLCLVFDFKNIFINYYYYHIIFELSLVLA